MNITLPGQGTLALLVITVLVTLLLNKTGGKLLELLARPVLWVWEAGYKKVAPYNPLSISLRSYKKHLRNSDFLSLLENPIGPALRVPLEQSFAPLRLTSGQNQPYVELFTYAASTPRFVVLGGPGTGKTTLMKSLLMSVLNGTSAENMNSLIPVFIPLRKLSSSQQDVQAAITTAFAEHHFPGAESFVRAALEQGRMLIVLDGLDEVGANREFVVSQVQDFCRWDSNNHRNHVIVTCRENSYLNEDLREEMPDIVRVEPFAAHHMRVFLKGWPAYHGKVAMNLFGPIQSDKQIREICSNPLLLTILTGLYFETDNFELPSSRDKFYVEAMKELLEKRPARRALKQTFSASDKQQILQRVALERLENAGPNEDPEEFTRGAIQRRATEVIGNPLAADRLSELIKELTETNGIIKPTRELSYTCAHRTIQEYLAACEARRSLEAKDVIDRLSERIYLREVIFFYCGLIDNVPQIGTVVTHFTELQQWEPAGRCLLNATQVPGRELLSKVAEGLYRASSSGPALEILSALAQRRGSAFDPFAQRLNDAVNVLVGKDADTAVSGLGVVLSSHPELASPLIPALLKHKSIVLRKLAIALLRDLGTDEALDQLVRLLEKATGEDKSEAARVISSLIATRGAEMKQRADFLPEKKDPTIWPLEAYFPGRLAIPVAEALGASTATDNRAISSAARAIEIRANPAASSEDRKFLRQWQRVGAYAAVFKSKRWIRARMLIVGGACTALTILVATLFTAMHLKGYVLIVQASHPRVRLAKIAPALDSLYSAAERVVSETNDVYPASAHGLARVLPWNWDVHPILPESNNKAYDLLAKLAIYDPYSVPWDLLGPDQLPPALKQDTITNFELAAATFRRQAVPFSGPHMLFGMFPSSRSPYISLLALPLFAAFVVFTTPGRLLSIIGRRAARRDATPLNQDEMLFFVPWMYMATIACGNSLRLTLLTAGFAIVAVLFLAFRLDWPTNPAFDSVKDLVRATGEPTLLSPTDSSE